MLSIANNSLAVRSNRQFDAIRARVHVRSARRGEQRAAVLALAAIFIPAPEGEQRLELEARASGAAIAVGSAPDEVVRKVRSLIEDDARLARSAAFG